MQKTRMITSVFFVVVQLLLPFSFLRFADIPPVHAALDPTQNEYLVSVGPVGGSTAANYVFASVLNPAASGKTVVIKRLNVDVYAVAAASRPNLTVRRITAASAGTQIAAADIPKKNTVSADTIVDVRYAGPTVTLAGTADSRIMSIVAPAAVGVSYGDKEIIFGSNEQYILQPGEGIALYQEAAGDVDHRVRMLVEWDEQSSTPASQGEYMFAYPRVARAAGANEVYHTFFNPAASGRVAVVKRIIVDVDCNGVAAYTNNFSVRGITGASGGTAIAAGAIPKKNTGSADSAMEFRHTTVTATLAGSVDSRLMLLTPCGAVNQSIGHQEILFGEGDEKLVLQPGEGIALYTEAAGDVNQLVRFSLTWQEVAAASAPASQGEYLFAYPRISDEAAAPAANTVFDVLFNPAGSGKTAIVKRIGIRNDADAAANYSAFTVRRITNATGGTVIASANIPKKHSSTGDAATTVLYCGTTCASAITPTFSGTVDSRILSVNGPGAVGQLIGQKEIVFDGDEKLVLQPGQGIAFYIEAAGDIDHYIKMFVEWDEEASAPASVGEYAITIGPVNGNAVTANYAYASLFNPAASGKTALVKHLWIGVDAAAAAAYVPFSVRRITAASAGTQIAAANVPVKHTGTANTVMDVRRTGVTVTLAGTIDSRIASVQSPGAVGAAAAPHLNGWKDMVFETDENIVLQPGEGIALYQEAVSSANLRVKLYAEWQEVASGSTPASQGDYSLSIGPVAGSLNANYVYGSLFNPSASGKNFVVKKIEIRADRRGALTAPGYIPATIRKTTAASAGTLLAAANVPKKHTGTANTTAEVRHTNVTVTLAGAADSRVAGVMVPGGVGQDSGDFEFIIVPQDELILKPGEGMALYQEAAAGDVNMVFRFRVVWSESEVDLETGTSGTQAVTLNVPSGNNYVGGAFIFVRESATASISQIVLTEQGTVNASNSLSNVKIYYETAVTCSYDGNETAFNAVGVSFDAAERATASGTMSVGTSQVCVYVVLDIGSTATNGQTLEIELAASGDVTVSAGTPTAASWPVEISGTTTLQKTMLTQNYFRIYTNNGLLDPVDPWPAGAVDLGENAAVTLGDGPPAKGDVLHIRTTILVGGLVLSAASLSLKLQFGQRSTTCDAISQWFDVGTLASTSLWRGYDNTGVADGVSLSGNPPTAGDLNISIADRAGTYEEQNNSAANPYGVAVGEDVEYDWVVQHNGAVPGVAYCFRMVKTDNTALDGYNFYPAMATSPYRPYSQHWRWYDDENNEMPVVALADENTAPSNMLNNSVVKLRMTVTDTAQAAGTDIKFKIQFSEFSDFSAGVFDVVEQGNCIASSKWCYGNGVDADNDPVLARVLTDSAMSGTHNESGVSSSAFDPPASASVEFEFTLRQSGAKTNTTYFFRAYDVSGGASVPVYAGDNYPSLSTSGTDMTFSISGVGVGVFTEGATTSVTTTSTDVNFGDIPIGSSVNAAQRLSVSTNAANGYTVYVYQRLGFLNQRGDEIGAITGTNASPQGWWSACDSSASGCFGYHTGDNVLLGGSTRFAPDDSFAQFESGAMEIANNTGPVTDEITDMLYRIKITNEQYAGNYQNNIVYIIVTDF